MASGDERRHHKSGKKKKKKSRPDSRASHGQQEHYYEKEHTLTEEEKHEIQPPDEDEEREIRPRRRKHKKDRHKSSRQSSPDDNIFTRAIPAPPLSDDGQGDDSDGPDDDSRGDEMMASEQLQRHRHRSSSSRRKPQQQSIQQKYTSSQDSEDTSGLPHSGSDEYFMNGDGYHKSRGSNHSSGRYEQQLHDVNTDAGSTTIESAMYEGMEDSQDEELNMEANDIHEAIKGGAWKAVFEFTLDPKQGYPFENLIEAFMDDRHYSFHTLLWKAPPALTKAILQYIEENDASALASLLMTRDGDENTPMHLFCGNLPVLNKSVNKHELVVLRTLIKSNPRVLQCQNKEGDTPLHLFVSSMAATAGNDFANQAAAEQTISLLLEASVESAILQDSIGATPLHVAISHSAHERVLLYLLETAPVAAKIKDGDEMLPLHYAAAVGLRMTYAPIQTLIETYPEGLLAKTVHGDTPLHLLIANLDENDDNSQETDYSHLDRQSTKVVELLAGFASGDDGSPELLLSRGSPVIIANDEKVSRCGSGICIHVYMHACVYASC